MLSLAWLSRNTLCSPVPYHLTCCILHSCQQRPCIGFGGSSDGSQFGSARRLNHDLLCMMACRTTRKKRLMVRTPRQTALWWLMATCRSQNVWTWKTLQQLWEVRFPLTAVITFSQQVTSLTASTLMLVLVRLFLGCNHHFHISETLPAWRPV